MDVKRLNVKTILVIRQQVLHYGLLLGLLLCSAAMLWPGISGPFLFDDESNIPKSFIQAFTFDELAAATWANTSGSLKRPVAALSFALSQYSSGPEPDGFKLHNILIHLCIGIVLFFTARRIFSALHFNHKQQQWAALLSAAFWLLHPLHISTVLYPVQRMAQLSTLFSLLAMYSYLRARQQPQQQGFWLFCVLPTSLLLALFSKENGALIPVFLLLLEALLFRFNKNNASKILQLSWYLFIATPLLLGAIYALSHPGLINYNNRSFTLVERCYTQLWVVAYYLKMIILPNINDMGIFHDDLKIIGSWSLALPAALIHIALAGSAIISLRKLPLISLGIAWFYCSHLIESTVLPLEMMFEHRNYLAVAGIAFIFAGCIVKLSHKKIFIVIAALFISHLALSSYERSSLWGNELSLYQANAANHPRSARSHVAYANQLLLRNEISLASRLLTRAAELNPTDAGPLLHLIKVSCFGPMSFSKDFYPHLLKHYSQHPLSAYGQQSLHQTSKLFVDGQCQSLDLNNFIQLLDTISGYADRRTAEILLIKARLASRSDMNTALSYYNKSYALAPDPRTLSEQAAMLIKAQRLDAAIAVVEKLLAIKNSLNPTRLREFNALFNWYNKQLETTAGDRP
ncbi:hypothetical protein NO559_09795 [Dasania sp. GY-MA-18]|uniref:Uncharacterized protein n=1 Tax=Dasania phycosphaerae TaxID=2950436 RepID=A0A9J6RMT0_9GAMM|nr:MULTISPECIES: hypothetical protein [Dasania]MCR8923064.1 hypothetical protein [Dasania sp. GY-MA-18]MCZ0865496.1 hypothetical protein [Dasania phycosphaerae]MCZ0869221.1 hypothetical protein [Dasania phycosphaerae]